MRDGSFVETRGMILGDIEPTRGRDPCIIAEEKW